MSASALTRGYRFRGYDDPGYFPAVLKRERSQSGAAYFVRRSPSRSSITVGRQRACQASRPSASAFCCSGVSREAARSTLPPFTVTLVDILGLVVSPATPRV